MKLKLFSFIILLLLLLFNNNIKLSKSETILLYADKCTNFGCAFSSLFSKVPSILDDVIVKTNSTAIQAIITLTESMSMKSLNISNGILKVGLGGSLTVSNNILVQVGSSLSIDGTSTCNSLILNGGGSINLSGTLNVNTQLSCDGIIKGDGGGGSIKINGTLNVKSMNLVGGGGGGGGGPIPIVYQNGVINLNGNANFSNGLTLNDNSQLLIKSGICTIDGVLTTTTNSIIHNLATLNIINSIKDIKCGIKFDKNSITNLIASKCNIYNIVLITSSSTINLQSSSSLSILNQQSSLITFGGPINVDSTSSITFDNSNCLLTSKSLSLVKGSLINVNNNSSVTIGVGIELLNDFNIDIGSRLIIESSSTNSFIGSVKCSIGSIVKVIDSIVNFKSPIVIDTLLIDNSKSSLINIISNVTITNGIESLAPLSKISIDPVIGILNIGGNSVIGNVLNLSGTSQFNLINKANCIISGLVPIEQSMVNLYQGCNLTITTSTNLTNNCLHLHGDSILQINANAIIGGLKVYPISQLQLPSLFLKDSNCNLLESIDKLGTINLIKSVLSLNDKLILNINNNLITDKFSNIILPINSNLIISGPNSIISNQLSIDGKLNIESGSISFNGGINSSVNSFLFCNNAKVSIGASSNFNGPFSVTGSSGSISISDGIINFYQGIQIPTTKCPFNILKSSTCNIHSTSLISSPVYCLNVSTLNIISTINNNNNKVENIIQFEGGLFTDINSMLSIDNSIISLNSTSIISGLVMLNESQLVSCGQTTFQNGIDSIINGKEGNNTLLVNSGSCLINTTNSIELSGSINIMEKAFLSIRSPNTTCYKGIKNSGSLLIGSIVNLKNSMINQLNGDSSLELLQGSNLITVGANFASGIVSGIGKITIINSTNNNNNSSSSESNSIGKCESGGILSGWITIDGQLKLLESSVIRVNIVSSTNVSKIICTGSTIINGLIDVLFDTDTVEETLTKGMIFPVLSSSISITGNLSLSDTLDSKQFSCKPQQQPSSSSSPTTSNTGSEYSLVYQQTNVPSNKITSTEDSTNSSKSIYNFTFYLLLISILISLF
ncbi:hypothetical protein ACTFIR_000100 [Dictyostelium discoideum]